MRRIASKAARAVQEPRWALRRIYAKTVTRPMFASLRYGSASAVASQMCRAVEDRSGPVFVFPAPSVAWGYLFQRPQQLARALWELGYPVLYAADPSYSEGLDARAVPIFRTPDGPVLFADGRGGVCVAEFARSRPVICWRYWPHQERFVAALPESAVIAYDVVDHLTCFEQYDAIRDDHQRALRSSAAVFASARLLCDEIRPVRPDVTLVPNGVRHEDFAAAIRAPDHDALPEFRGIPPEAVVIGYYGALAEWVDYELIEELARREPSWWFVFIGDRVSFSPRIDRFQKIPNVRVIGRQPYARLSALLARMNVAIIPFKVNDLTVAVSPVKLFEYAAGQKPVVSAALPECVEVSSGCSGVRIASGADEWMDQMRWCLAQGRSEQTQAALEALAASSTWRARARTIVAALRDKGVPLADPAAV